MGGGSSGNVNHSYKFTGVIFNMAQHPKKSKAVQEPHTEFRIAVDPLEQNIFERIIEEIALGSQYVELTIKTFTQEKRKK